MSTNGERLEAFTVRLDFNRTGQVEAVYYACDKPEECGLHPFDLGGSVDDVVLAHINHMRDVHGIRPARRCAYRLDSSDGPLMCIRDPHGQDIKHHFEL